jgi:HEAT repeat protein
MKILRFLFGGQRNAPTTSATVGHTKNQHPLDRYVAGRIQDAKSAINVEDLQALMRDYSGYVREAAIARSVELSLPELFPLVAERLNDWVPQVRRLARKALVTMLPFVPSCQVLSTLPAILLLHCSGRDEYSSWLNEFETVLIAAIPVEEFIANAKGKNIKTARACVHLIRKHNLLEAVELFNLILGRNDDIVLANLAMQYCAELPSDNQIIQYKVASRSHFGSVRTIALKKVLEYSGEDGHQFAIAALDDPQSSVRFVAVNYLCSQGIDVRARYHELLGAQDLKARKLRILVTALASLKDASDIPRIKSFCENPDISVRRAAYNAWHKLAHQDKDEISICALQDTARGVRKFAYQLVCRYGAYIPFSEVEEILLRSGDLQMLLMFAEREKWRWLEYIVRLNQDINQPASDALNLRESLARWFAFSVRSFERPSEAQARLLSSSTALSSLERLMPNGRQRIDLMVEEIKTFTY